MNTSMFPAFKTVAIVLSVYLSFIACKEDTSMSKLMEASFRLTSNTLADGAIEKKRLIHAVLADEAQAEYAKVGEMIDSIDAAYSSTKDRLDSLERTLLKSGANYPHVANSMKSLHVLVGDFIENAFNSYSKLLHEGGTRYGLREEEIEDLVQKMNAQKGFTLLLITPQKELDNLPESMLWLAKCKMDLEGFHLEIVDKIGEMIGGRPISCYFGIYPLVLPQQNCVKKGDIFRASIGLVPYDLPFAPEDVQLYVDGKALKFIKGWYTKFETPALTENTTVKISCKVKDEITGKMMETFTDFPYEIKVE